MTRFHASTVQDTDSDDRALQMLQAEATRRDEEQMAALALRIEAAALLDRAIRSEDKVHSARKKGSAGTLQRLRQLAFGPSGSPSSTAWERYVDRCAAVILKSGLFESEYYLRRNPDVAATGIEPVMHYVRRGASELRSPGPFFSTRWYVERYPDVRESGKNPLHHYIAHGHAEGRRPLPPNSAFPDSEVERVPAAGAPAFGSIARNGMSASTRCAAAPQGRLVVYTALFGDYDDLFVPSPEQAANCDFVIFTDQPNIPSPWRRGRVDFANEDNSKRNRFHKLLPHRLFPQYEWSLYLDANIDLRSDPIAFLDRYCDLGPAFFLFPHPMRTSVAEELGACIVSGKGDAASMVRQVARYLDSGFRHAFPLTENNVLLRRHNEPDLIALGEAWWAEVRSKSGRDQLSLPYIVEKSGYRDIALFGNDISARSSPDFLLRPHHTRSYYADRLDGRAQ